MFRREMLRFPLQRRGETRRFVLGIFGLYRRPDVGLLPAPRRPRRPAATVSASLTTFRQPGRGMILRYIMRHTARLPPGVG